MENRSNDLLIGSFVLLFVIAIAGFFIWLTNADVDGKAQPYRIFVRQAVTGLQTGSPVRFLGVPVGVVTDIRIDPETLNRVRIEIEVPEGTPIREDSTASLEQQGITGGVFVQISPGTDTSPLLLDTTGAEVPVIKAKASQFTELLEAAPVLLENLIQLSERATQALSESNIAVVGSTLKNVEQMSKDLSEASQKLGPILERTDTLLQTYTEVGQNTGDKLAKFLDDTDKSVKTITGASVSTFEAMTKTSQAFDKTAELANGVAKQAGEILKENRGPLNDFSSNGLYELTFLFQELRGLVSNLNLVAERLERGPTEFLFGNSQNGVKLEQ
jgi:phospholipid/cholesterol/gamma-HCH transport system substrate-binding protein